VDTIANIKYSQAQLKMLREYDSMSGAFKLWTTEHGAQILIKPLIWNS
jgi:hypothetical protein